uniref:Uncharacterized protein n=1 Tax=Oryza nivara TaxID=4536 RepID=A0A0E0HMC2_ORYNI
MKILSHYMVLPMLQKASTSDEEIRSVEATGSSGHSSQKHEEGKGWYKFDDECVRPITEDSIKTPAAYLCFMDQGNISMMISDSVLSPELCCLTNNRRLLLPSVLFSLIALDKYSDISQEHLFCLDISQNQTRLPLSLPSKPINSFLCKTFVQPIPIPVLHPLEHK